MELLQWSQSLFGKTLQSLQMLFKCVQTTEQIMFSGHNVEDYVAPLREDYVTMESAGLQFIVYAI